MTEALLSGLKELLALVNATEEAVLMAGPETQPVLAERMAAFTARVAQLRGSTAALDGLRIPVDMLQYLDDGGNVNQYTAEVFHGCVRDNQASKGKVEAVQCLWDAVMAKLGADAPEQAQSYRQLLGTQNPQPSLCIEMDML